MVVTHLRNNKRGGKIAVFVDGDYSFSIGENTLIKENLFVGKQLDQGQLDQINRSDKENDMYQKAVGLISIRPRSESEIKKYISKKLRREKIAPEIENLIIAAVINRLAENKYLNDLEFARWWVNNRIEFKLKSRNELRVELGRQGVSSDIRELILNKLYRPEIQQKLIAELIQNKKQHFKLKTKSEREYNQKITQFLLRKGFSWEEIKTAGI